MSDDVRPAPLLEVHAELGEGPIWDGGFARLLFVDILTSRIHVFDPAARTHHVVETGLQASAIARTRTREVLVAAGRGFYRVDLERASAEPVALVERDDGSTRMNDGAVDAAGRFWAGSMSTRGEAGQGTLWRLDPSGSAHAILTGVTTSNGPDWSPDNRLMYYADTRTRRIDVFDFDVDCGTIANRRVFADFSGSAGRPDGLIVDAEGGIWVALWAGGALHRYQPDGRLDRVVPFPVTLTTKAAFGGPDLMDLFVTTARGQLTPEERAAQPLAGALFHLRPGIRGRVTNVYAG